MIATHQVGQAAPKGHQIVPTGVADVRQPSSIYPMDLAFLPDVAAAHDASERKDKAKAPITAHLIEIRPQKHHKTK